MSRIFVCPLSALPQTLAKSGARHMISLAGPGKTEARPSQITGAYLALEFNDIPEPREELIAPTRADIAALVDYFTNWDRREPVVIHCWMGISRSTAAALIGCVTVDPRSDATVLANALRDASPMATPNPLMIRLADEELQLHGALINAVSLIGRGANASEGVPFIINVESGEE